jgi:hypothetical protein
MSAALRDVAEGQNAYVDELLALLGTVETDLLLPFHDGTIEALRTRRTEIERRCALALAGDDALAVATSKPRTLALAAELGIVTPHSIPVTNFSDLRATRDVVGYPAVMKPVGSWAHDESGAGTRLSSELVQTLTKRRPRSSNCS